MLHFQLTLHHNAAAVARVHFDGAGIAALVTIRPGPITHLVRWMLMFPASPLAQQLLGRLADPGRQ